ncbi:hypothetical protein XENTR_v10005388 [Xenopus tropicalis]|nr:hypothetical protein XENTR_v10005388 [Xenopus tropicalis]
MNGWGEASVDIKYRGYHDTGFYLIALKMNEFSIYKFNLSFQSISDSAGTWTHRQESARRPMGLRTGWRPRPLGGGTGNRNSTTNVTSGPLESLPSKWPREKHVSESQQLWVSVHCNQGIVTQSGKEPLFSHLLHSELQTMPVFLCAGVLFVCYVLFVIIILKQNVYYGGNSE